MNKILSINENLVILIFFDIFVSKTKILSINNILSKYKLIAYHILDGNLSDW